MTRRASRADTQPTQTRKRLDLGRGLDAAGRTRRRRRIAAALGLLVLLDVVVAVAAVIVLGAVDDDGGGRATAVRRTELPAFVQPEKRRLARAFARAAHESRVPVALLEALAWRESRWQASAYNPVSGATGIGQLLPETSVFVAGELLREPTLDPRVAVDNIRLTARYLRALIDGFAGDTTRGLAAYLQGSTSVATAGISEQTAQYLGDIATFRASFERAARGHDRR